MGEVYRGDVSFYGKDHERKVEGVVSPVLGSVVYEDLFMGFDVACSAKVEAISFGMPFGIFPTFVK